MFKVVRKLSQYLNVTDPLIISLIFIFLSCRKKVHDNRIQSWKFKTSSWIMNHDPLNQTLKLSLKIKHKYGAGTTHILRRKNWSQNSILGVVLITFLSTCDSFNLRDKIWETLPAFNTRKIFPCNFFQVIQRLCSKKYYWYNNIKNNTNMSRINPKLIFR